MAVKTGQTTMFNTRIDIDQDKREELVSLINQQLADTLDLFTQTKQAHWNVKGLDFFQVHELLDDLAKTVRKQTDMIAERATALGGVALGTARMSAENSTLTEYPTDVFRRTRCLERSCRTLRCLRRIDSRRHQAQPRVGRADDGRYVY